MKSFGSSIVSILLAASLVGFAAVGSAADQMSPKLRAEQARATAIKACQKDCEKKKGNDYEACMLGCSKANYTVDQAAIDKANKANKANKKPK